MRVTSLRASRPSSPSHLMLECTPLPFLSSLLLSLLLLLSSCLSFSSSIILYPPSYCISTSFLDLVEEYQDVILANLFGHTHNDQVPSSSSFPTSSSPFPPLLFFYSLLFFSSSLLLLVPPPSSLCSNHSSPFRLPLISSSSSSLYFFIYFCFLSFLFQYVSFFSLKSSMVLVANLSP